MEPFFRSALAILVFLAVKHCCTYDPSPRKHEWKKLILVHHWPVTVCKMDRGLCKNPPAYWTVHGLWPDKSQMCNNSWPFELCQIQDILPEMNQYWPDLLHANKSQLWKHEWQKHGTCAASLETLNTQHKYFGKGIELYKYVDLNSALIKSGIKPSTSYYQMKDIEDAVKGVYGVLPKIQCLPPQKGETAQTLGQIELCFTKEFQLRDCAEIDDLLYTFYDMKTKSEPYNDDLHVCNQNISTLYPPVEQL
ncbi:hypothetical protein GDO86_009624 [Hymenochirus boettgeri]|uniref:Uncharacterized protein n=1 Tax=Hymenochirus boettgeri TaxID=247094 RepID=A0A8T2JPM7_9PIPI|nr:hypothetical protein GDO86_009624 [Hymenochirus boettgeri]